MSRLPTDLRSPRMGALSRLPVFYALEGKRALVAGGTAAAAWKAELLSAAGAQVDVLAADPGDDMRTLATAPPGGSVTIHRASWKAEGFVGAVGDGETEAARF